MPQGTLRTPGIAPPFRAETARNGAPRRYPKARFPEGPRGRPARSRTCRSGRPRRLPSRPPPPPPAARAQLAASAREARERGPAGGAGARARGRPYLGCRRTCPRPAGWRRSRPWPRCGARSHRPARPPCPTALHARRSPAEPPRRRPSSAIKRRNFLEGRRRPGRLLPARAREARWAGPGRPPAPCAPRPRGCVTRRSSRSFSAGTLAALHQLRGSREASRRQWAAGQLAVNV